MLCLLRVLEPRREEKGVTLVRELDEFNEVYFFNRGIYEIGFEINHRCFFQLRYKNSNVIGAYGVTFNVRALFVYKTFSACEGFSIRKQNWISEILEQNDTIMSVIKNSVKQDYETYVKRKLLQEKKKLIQRWMARSDYEAILVVQSHDQMNQQIKHAEKMVEE